MPASISAPSTANKSVEQLNLFPTAPTGSVAGIRVILPGRSCPACGSEVLLLGSSKAMHNASVTCTACDRHCGWAGRATVEYVKLLGGQGDTTEPIIVPAMDVLPFDITERSDA